MPGVDIEEIKKVAGVVKEYENDSEVVTMQTAREQKAAEEWELAKKVKNPFRCLRVARVGIQGGQW